MKETEQTLLDQIKDQVAREFGYSAYRDFINGMDDSEMIVQIAERYATAKAQASCEATLKNAADNAKWGRQDGTNKRAIVKSSITNPSNITIV